MRTYSLSFLSHDWDGAGYDFAFAAVFAAEKLETPSIRAFVIQLSRIAKVSIRLILESDTGHWQTVEAAEVARFLDKMFDWEATQLLVADVETSDGFVGYVEINVPDQVVVGAPSENYYKGSLERDHRLVSDLIGIIELAVASFGNAHGSFGAGSNSIVDAENLRASGATPNLKQPLGTKVREDITLKCTEIRESAE